MEVNLPFVMLFVECDRVFHRKHVGTVIRINYFDFREGIPIFVDRVIFIHMIERQRGISDPGKKHFAVIPVKGILVKMSLV
ncbi:hypothetical protein D3C80_1903580 [compost metagenome]